MFGRHLVGPSVDGNQGVRKVSDILLGLVALGLLIIGLRWGGPRRDPAKEAREAIYEEAEAMAKAYPPGTPLVSFTYHTYDGNIVYAMQRKHTFELPLPVAKHVLDRLMRYTLKHGIFAVGGALTPFLAYFNYRTQLRSIEGQARKGNARVVSKAVRG